jgi:penicillin-binding protein 2
MGNVSAPVETQVRSQVPVDPGYLEIVRAGMRQSVTNGVARNAGIPNIAVAGKTGTAEFGTEQANGKFPTHGWFIGFAPYDDPQVAIVVFLQRASGNDAAAAAGRMLDLYFNGPRAVPLPTIGLSGPPAETPQPEPSADAQDSPPETDAPVAPIDTPIPAPVEPVPTAAPEPIPEPVTPAPEPEPPPETPPPEPTAAPQAQNVTRREPPI